ncbi:MAG TPA: hypothetical protein VKX17_06135 [Planctomycetota bacterium]|nr:hypothetical protein [Planctomycetota bacterium]
MVRKMSFKKKPLALKTRIVGKWDDSLIGCPSQCYADAIGPGGFRYVLYLRWRHSDPWIARVIQTKCNAQKYQESWNKIKAKRSPDLFEMYNVFLKEEQLGAAKAKIVDVADKWLRSRPRKWDY